jgi:hypothetical protein
MTFVLSNGDQTLSPDSSSSPFNCLLSQNAFLNNTFQTAYVRSVTFDGLPANWTMATDEDGNPLIQVLTANPLMPHENATLSIIYEISLSSHEFNLSGVENISQIPKGLVAQYPLTGSWNLSKMGNASAVVDTAYAIKGNDENTLAVVYDILGWFESNMVYAYNLTLPQDVWTTFSTHSGDCDDQANLFILFCRVLGIPAYLSIGAIYSPGTDVESDGNLHFNLTNTAWHGWAMVYLPTQTGGEWVPVDLTYFSGGEFNNGHIVSSELSQHITGSALALGYTAVSYSVATMDYVGQSVSETNLVQSSDVNWFEYHVMTSVAAPNESTPVSQNLIIIILLIALAIATLAIMTFRFLRQRSYG